MAVPKPHSPFVRHLFFWSGIIATVAYRAVIFFNGHSKFWVSALWYLGTVGFIVYFAHRYQISERRAKLIRQAGLDGKIAKLDGLSPDDQTSILYIFQTLESSKEKINYIVIFASSGLALVASIYLDFFR